MQKRGLLSLAMAAAVGFRGIVINIGSDLLGRYDTKARRSTAQFSDARYPKKTGLTIAAAQRAALKAKNRAKHRRACRV
jgi:hypothetical protein